MKSSFTKDFSRLNRMESGLWLLGPGMAFGDRQTWWGGNAPRPRPHNGVDLAFMRTPDGVQHNLEPGTLVPTPFDGRVACVFPDYLGLSIVLEHDIDIDGGRLISAFGHMAPQQLLAPGVKIKSGATLGSIAKPKDHRVPPHIHLTLAVVPEGYRTSTISWEKMDSGGEVQLIDPRRYF